MSRDPQPGHILWHMAACLDCQPPLPMPFYDRYKRDTWASEHSDATDHRVVLFREEQRA